MLTINRRHSIPGLVRSEDNGRIAEGLSHAEAPTHRQQSVSLSCLACARRVMDARAEEVVKHERSVRVA